MRKTKDIEESKESNLRDTLNVLMDSQISIMRSIKSNELTWVNYYILIMGAAIGFFATSSSLSKDTWTFHILQFLALFLTVWFLHIFSIERLSYYQVLRTVNRIQNYLGLFGTLDVNNNVERVVLSHSVLDAGFPKGFGINKRENGTKPNSSFLWRTGLVIVIYSSFLIVSFDNKGLIFNRELFCPIVNRELINPFVPLLIAILYWRYCFYNDRKSQEQAVRNDEGLLGSEKDWYQSPKTN